ncbi:MAG: glycosyltransferase [Phycisphaerae bacterium]
MASDLPPSRKYVQEVGCGLLVPPADVDAWAVAMLELLNDPTRARELGRRGRQAFLERFNWEACEPAFLEFYEALGGKKGKQQ